MHGLEEWMHYLDYFFILGLPGAEEWEESALLGSIYAMGRSRRRPYAEGMGAPERLGGVADPL